MRKKRKRNSKGKPKGKSIDLIFEKLNKAPYFAVRIAIISAIVIVFIRNMYIVIAIAVIGFACMAFVVVYWAIVLIRVIKYYVVLSIKMHRDKRDKS